jgi:hypothetical protein
MLLARCVIEAKGIVVIVPTVIALLFVKCLFYLLQSGFPRITSHVTSIADNKPDCSVENP